MTNSNHYLEYDLTGRVVKRFFIKNGMVYWDGREIGICFLRDIIYKKASWQASSLTLSDPTILHRNCYWLVLE